MKTGVTFILLLFSAVFNCRLFDSAFDYETDGSDSDSSNVLLETFNDEHCVNPCWLGIEVGTSSEANVQTALQENEIEFEVVDSPIEGLRVYSFELDPMPFPFVGIDKTRGSILINPIADRVGRIDLPLDLCVNELLAAYGNPDVITSVGYLELVYPEQGLIFYLDIDEQNIWAVTLLTEEYLVNEYMPNWEIQDWDAVYLDMQSCS